MVRVRRRRAFIGFLIATSSLVVVNAPAAPADAAGSCFNISVTNDIRMQVPEIDEASGLVLSRQMPGVMWTHNDDDPTASDFEDNRIYAVNELGQLLATVQFNLLPYVDVVPDSRFVDLEDISFGHGPNGDPNYLYLADTGDNNPVREFASIYRIPEPVFTPDPDNPVTIDIAESEMEATHFQYQSYVNPTRIKPRNVEGVFVDPASGSVFLFEKGRHAIDANGVLADGSGLPKEYAFVYRLGVNQLFPSDPSTIQLASVVSHVKASFAGSTSGITGADIAVDGSIIAVKSIEETFYWRRDPAEPVLTTFANDPAAPCLAPSAMRGEGLAIGPTSDRFVVIREGLLSPIWQAVFTNQTHTCFGQPATIVGTAGDDVITGTPGNDVIVTFGGNDSVNAGKGIDRICLGPGDDYANGGNARDRIDGGWGDDTIAGGKGADILWGGDGDDDVQGMAGADTLRGGGGHDRLSGGSGDDKVFGNNGADSLLGNAAGDSLWGGRGADTVEGGKGNDALAGGAGTDACNGGQGTDSATKCEQVVSVP